MYPDSGIFQEIRLFFAVIFHGIDNGFVSAVFLITAYGNALPVTSVLPVGVYVPAGFAGIPQHIATLHELIFCFSAILTDKILQMWWRLACLVARGCIAAAVGVE